LRALVLKALDPEQDKMVRWRCIDPLAEVKQRFSVEAHESKQSQAPKRSASGGRPDRSTASPIPSVRFSRGTSATACPRDGPSRPR
jgi:hypothetical protein